jgi:hypothetical protein
VRVFTEDFQGYAVGSDGSPIWMPVTGKWVIELEDNRKVYVQRDTGVGYPQIALSNKRVRDGRVEVTLKVERGNYAGLVFRASDGKNMYQCYTTYERPPNLIVGLSKYVNGEWSGIRGAVAGPGRQGDMVNIAVDFFGSSIKVYVNKTFLFEVQDSTFRSGYVGLITWHGTTAKFYSVATDISDIPLAIGIAACTIAGGLIGYASKPMGKAPSTILGAILGACLGGGLSYIYEVT